MPRVSETRSMSGVPVGRGLDEAEVGFSVEKDWVSVVGAVFLWR
jgi:hypothetical protein